MHDDLINKTLRIVNNNPWNEFNNAHSIIIEYQDNFYIIEFSNNKCNIYPNVNNVYIPDKFNYPTLVDSLENITF